MTKYSANRYWGDRTPPQSKAEFFNAITSLSPSGEGEVATIRMYGPIDSWGGYWGISTKDVGQVLDGLPDSVERIVLRINSPGGEVFEAVSILNMLRAHKATVTAVVDGLAASAASVIAAGCDEAVMSPGTTLMIHKPWVFAWGDSDELRKSASVLDSLESSMVEIYEAKAGVKDWAALLFEETWLTAAEAVNIGLADRVAVIPDAGETATVGESATDLDEAWDAITVQPVAQTPVSTEPGGQGKEVAMSDFLDEVRTRLGVTDASAAEDVVLAALDEALAEQGGEFEHVLDSTPAIPEGAVIVDAEAFASLQSAAADGIAARAEQDKERRDGIIATAVSEGRIAPAARETWRSHLDKDEDGAKSLIESLPANTVPVAEIGHAGEAEDASSALYNKVAGSTKKGA